MLTQLSCVHAQGCRQMCLQSCKTVASAAAGQSCELQELSYGLWHSCGSRAIKRKFIAWLSRGSLGVFVSVSPCVSRTNALHVLQQPCVSCGRASSEDRKEVLLSCTQHSKTATKKKKFVIVDRCRAAVRCETGFRVYLEHISVKPKRVTEHILVNCKGEILKTASLEYIKVLSNIYM